MQACADLLLLSTHLSVGAVFHHCYNDVLSSHEWQLLTHVFLYHLTIQTHAHMQKVYSRHVAWGNSPPPEVLNSPRKFAGANFQSWIKMSKILAFHGCCCNWRSIIGS